MSLTKSISLPVPICLLGQSIVHLNQPVLCYVPHDDSLSITINQGGGFLRVKGVNPISYYLERKLSWIAQTMKLDIDVQVIRPSTLIDTMITIIHAVVREKGLKSLHHAMLKRVKLREERVRLTISALKFRGVLAYREGENPLELQREFPWLIGFCFRAPLKFKLLEDTRLEEAINVVVHALGRLVILAARSIIDRDFGTFKSVMTRYSRLSLALSNHTLSILRAFNMIAKVDSIACKVDEDIRGLLLFSEDREGLTEGLNMAQAMGFKVMLLRC